MAQSLIAVMLNAKKLIHFLYTFSKFKSDTPLNKMATLWEADKMQKCKIVLQGVHY